MFWTYLQSICTARANRVTAASENHSERRATVPADSRPFLSQCAQVSLSLVFFLWWFLTTTPITLCSPPPPISLDRYSAAIVKLLGLPFYCSLLALDTNAIMLNFKSAWMCASACCFCCVWLVASPLRWSPARPPAHHWNLPTPHGHLERMFLITNSARMYMYGKCPGKREERRDEKLVVVACNCIWTIIIRHGGANFNSSQWISTFIEACDTTHMKSSCALMTDTTS